MDLRSATQCDLDGLHALWNEPGVVKWRGSGLHWPREVFEEWFSHRVVSKKHWLCVVEEEGKIAGLVAFDDETKLLAIHIMLFPEFRGQGMGKRALEQLIPLAQKKFGVAIIVAVILPGNKRSIKLFENLGFEYASDVRVGEKILQGYILKDGTMQICVCGWYFRPDFYKLLREINEKYPVTVVANQLPRDDVDKGFFMIPEGRGRGIILPDRKDALWLNRKNIGLEWGAYDYFLKNLWDGESSVLFMHDDVRVWPVIQDYQVIEPIKVFDVISKFLYGQVYLFRTLQQAIDNYYIHGRAFFCSAQFLKRLLKDNNGFWFDENNTGHISGPTPKHCKHYNEADYRFAKYIKSVKDMGDVGDHVVLPALDCARRGKFIEEEIGPVEED